ncbi:MAG: hypothetical protein ACFB0G_07655, partial [Leptolyngbyaceae cyanobacterium]
GMWLTQFPLDPSENTRQRLEPSCLGLNRLGKMLTQNDYSLISDKVYCLIQGDAPWLPTTQIVQG